MTRVKGARTRSDRSGRKLFREKVKRELHDSRVTGRKRSWRTAYRAVRIWYIRRLRLWLQRQAVAKWRTAPEFCPQIIDDYEATVYILDSVYVLNNDGKSLRTSDGTRYGGRGIIPAPHVLMWLPLGRLYAMACYSIKPTSSGREVPLWISPYSVASYRTLVPQTLRTVPTRKTARQRVCTHLEVGFQWVDRWKGGHYERLLLRDARPEKHISVELEGLGDSHYLYKSSLPLWVLLRKDVKSFLRAGVKMHCVQCRAQDARLLEKGSFNPGIYRPRTLK